MKCPYCGGNLADGARRCNNCGEYLGENMKGSLITKKVKSPGKNGAAVFLVIIGLICLLIIGLAVFLQYNAAMTS